MQVHTRILLGLGAGAVAGGLANVSGWEWLQELLVGLEPVGSAFIRLITMIVVPLIVASLLVGTASLGDVRRLGRLGLKTLGYYSLTTCLAVGLGILLADLLRPGSGIDKATREALIAQSASQESTLRLDEHVPTVREVLLSIIPRNPVQAAAEFDLLPLIFFSVIFGAALGSIDEELRTSVLRFFEGINAASMLVIRWVMWLAPYAVFSLIAAVVARFGIEVLKSLFVYACTVVLGLTVHVAVTLTGLVRVGAKLRPAEFYRRVLAVPVFAFSTSSSNATLPLTLETAEKKLGISRAVSRFVLPLGATINMDGTALYQAVATLFIAQVYGFSLDWTTHLTILLTATLASIGAAGVPSAGLITLIVVLQSVGLGSRVESGIAMVLGVDRLLDMFRTSVNVLGDLVCATVIARSEGEALFGAAEGREAVG